VSEKPKSSGSEVLRLLGQGISNLEISKALDLSFKTASTLEVREPAADRERRAGGLRCAPERVQFKRWWPHSGSLSPAIGPAMKVGINVEDREPNPASTDVREAHIASGTRSPITWHSPLNP